MKLALASVLLAGCAASAPAPRAEDCPVCHKPVADGPEIRVVRSGESDPGTRYRCFLCPIMQGETGESWTMRAVTGLDGRWVTFRVEGERVTCDPPTAVVLALAVKPGDECLDVHRVFTDEAEFRRYLAKHPALEGATPRRLEDVLAEHRK